ncbi:hypothetical protein AAB992_38350 [Burkholderia contaminans]|uniref:hypothetical protein n=1 Tax=Burkholderia contaminans TaxID=488447 RepID=UPI002418043C|nr:hypothetical protein [Burkholderia contaminans]WFN14897.1 hypothetical protein LXE92_32195 [Burkholderia contaminans]
MSTSTRYLTGVCGGLSVSTLLNSAWMVYAGAPMLKDPLALWLATALDLAIACVVAGLIVEAERSRLPAPRIFRPRESFLGLYVACCIGTASGTILTIGLLARN